MTTTISEKLLGAALGASQQARSRDIEARFPEVEAQVAPLGNMVLVQIMLPREKSDGGIIFADDTIDANQDSTQVAKVIAIGPMAFHNQTTGEPWPEGSWVHEGDFVRVSSLGGHRWRVPRGQGTRPVEFLMLKDLQLLGKVDGDPTRITSYV